MARGFLVDWPYHQPRRVFTFIDRLASGHSPFIPLKGAYRLLIYSVPLNDGPRK